MDRRTTDRLVELFVVVPVSVALQLADDLPKVLHADRKEVEERVKVARWMGEMAVQFGRREVEKRLEQLTSPRPPQAPAAAPAAPAAPDVPPPRTHGLQEPFQGYDTLAAAQLLPLLERLPESELHLVRDYELATRGRRTVLAKIDLLSGS